jgi:hypothetical protein
MDNNPVTGKRATVMDEQEVLDKVAINTLLDEVMYEVKETKYVSMEDIFRPLFKVSSEKLLEQSGTPYQVMLQQTFGHLKASVPLYEEARNNKSTFDFLVQCALKCPVYTRPKVKLSKAEAKEAKEKLVAVA